jgi:hypothetical protein
MALDDGDGTRVSSGSTRDRMLGFQSALGRMVATGGIVGIGTGVAAIMGSQEVDAWIIGIVVAGLSVALAAVVWSAKSV